MRLSLSPLMKPPAAARRGAVALFALCLGLFAGDARADDGEWLEPAPAGEAPADEAADWGEEAAIYSEEGAPATGDEYADTDAAALSDFRPYLDPNGVWLYDPVYGQVWVPDRTKVGADFAPYVTNGYWGIDENGDWIWVSGYDFGWVVFHYGRWVWIPDVGWSWVPGRRYAPAWVVWRVPTAGSTYIGWAPMPPTWGWHGGVAMSLWVYPPYPYVFCDTRYVFHHHVHTHIIHDHGRVRYAADRTRRYRPATPRGARGPSPRASGVPSGSRPKERTPAKPEAKRAASKRTAAQIRKPAYRAKPLPGAGAAARTTAQQKGGRVLPARNFEASPTRPRTAPSAAGASQRPATRVAPSGRGAAPSPRPSPSRAARSGATLQDPAGTPSRAASGGRTPPRNSRTLSGGDRVAPGRTPSQVAPGRAAPGPDRAAPSRAAAGGSASPRAPGASPGAQPSASPRSAPVSPRAPSSGTRMAPRSAPTPSPGYTSPRAPSSSTRVAPRSSAPSRYEPSLSSGSSSSSRPSASGSARSSASHSAPSSSVRASGARASRASSAPRPSAPSHRAAPARRR
ncbi:MAG: hypothetical protein KIT72_17145 [Polyangiaceae bacterium]|nr:hypothetical protein [Polyangiaceae bacterium]